MLKHCRYRAWQSSCFHSGLGWDFSRFCKTQLEAEVHEEKRLEGHINYDNTAWAAVVGGKRNCDKEFRKWGEDPCSQPDPGRGRMKWGKSSQRSVGCSHLLQQSPSKTTRSQTSPPLSSQQTSSKPTSKAPSSFSLKVLCSYSPSTLILNF